MSLRFAEAAAGPARCIPQPVLTPLVDLPVLPGAPDGVRILGKLESGQPSGSIKDRPVRRMLEALRADGSLRGRRVLDSSSGNAGIAYAMYGALLGLPVTLVVPGNASRERLQRIRAHGAELVLTDPLEGYDHAVREARRMAAENPGRYCFVDQYGNRENWRAHYEGTGAEILRQARQQLGGAPDAFVCGVGTGGTLTGVGRRLRRAKPRTVLGVVVPEVFPGIEGLKPLGAPDDIVPAILDEGLIDARLPVPHERALEGCRALAAAGLFVGPSSGAFLWAATELARQRPELRTIVVPLCDTGERYGSSGMWEVDGLSSAPPAPPAPPTAAAPRRSSPDQARSEP